MLIKPYIENWLDEKDRPAGGVAYGNGFAISWQNGPLGRGNDRKQPNGAFVESVLYAVKERIEFYQESEFNCEENMVAIYHIKQALDVLNSRTNRREKSGTEGTHQGN